MTSSAPTPPIRVLLADAHEVVRRGLAKFLEARGDIVVVGEATTGAEALTRGLALRPDVAVLDVRLPDCDSVSFCRQLRSRLPDLKVMMLTSDGGDESLPQAIAAGAAGYLRTGMRGEELADAVRTVAGGEPLLAPSVTRRLVERYVGGPAADEAARLLADLTPREREVLDLVVAGLSNAEVGARLFLSEATVKTHVSRLLAKLGVRDRVQAVVAAYESGLVRPGEEDGRSRVLPRA